MKFRIYQLPDKEFEEGNWKETYLFMDYDYAKDHNFTIEDYKIVWEGELNATLPHDTALELIYRKFNIDHPLEYVGRSLSVSDLVELDGKIYYCDDVGWKLVDADHIRA